jgi:hypothetical protein
MDLSLIADLTIGGVAIAPLIVGLVNLAKRAGLPASYAPYLNGVLAVAGYLLVQYIAAHPDLLQTAQIVAVSVLIFLTASGMHQLGKTSLR